MYVKGNVGKHESQLKILQLILQILGNIIKDSKAMELLNEAMVCNIMTIVLSLTGKHEGNSAHPANSPAVINTAFISVRQIISLLFGKLQTDAMQYVDMMMSSSNLSRSVILQKYDSSLKTSLELLLKEITYFMKGNQGHWLQKIPSVPIIFALDLIYDVVNDWREICISIPAFCTILKDHICVTLRNLLKHLQEDYIVALRHCNNSKDTNSSNANIYVTKTVKIARCIMLKYSYSGELMSEIETIITLLLHTLHPDKTKVIESGETVSNHKTYSSFISFITGNTTNDHEGNISANSGNGDKLTTYGGAVNVKMQSSGASSIQNCGTVYLPLCSASGTSMNPTPAYSSNSQTADAIVVNDMIPSHPAAICLEALLAYYLRERIAEDMVRFDKNICDLNPLEAEDLGHARSGSNAGFNSTGVSSFTVCISTSLLSVCTLMLAAFSAHTNATDYEAFSSNCYITAMVDSIIDGNIGTNGDIQCAVHQINDYLYNLPAIGSMHVLSLSYAVFRVITRSVMKQVVESCAVGYDLPNGHGLGVKSPIGLLPLRKRGPGGKYGGMLYISPFIIEGDLKNDSSASMDSKRIKCIIKSCLLSVIELCHETLYDTMCTLVQTTFPKFNVSLSRRKMIQFISEVCICIVC